MSRTRTNKGKVRKKMVWHIVKFRERYEMPDDVRSFRVTPLLYTKDFVGNGNDGESAAFYQQMCELRSKPNRLQLRGVFSELKENAANKNRPYRGYLLDQNYEPASDKKIGAWLGLNEDDTIRILKELDEIELIEKVTLPVFESEDDGQTAGKQRSGHGRNRKKKDKKNRFSGNHRKRPEIAGNYRKPLYINGKYKDKYKYKDKADSLTAIGKDKSKRKKKTAKGNAESAMPNGKGKGKSKAKDKAEDKPIGESKTTRSPTTTPLPKKIKPTKSDGEGQVNCRDAAGLPPRRFTGKFESICRVYDPKAKEFGAEVFEALKVRHLPTSLEGRRELGNYAAAWSLAQASGLSFDQLNDLWDKAIKSARDLAKKRKRRTFNKSPEAVWRYIFNRLLDKAKSELNEQRIVV